MANKDAINLVVGADETSAGEISKYLQKHVVEKYDKNPLKVKIGANYTKSYSEINNTLQKIIQDINSKSSGFKINMGVNIKDATTDAKNASNAIKQAMDNMTKGGDAPAPIKNIADLFASIQNRLIQNIGLIEKMNGVAGTDAYAKVLEEENRQLRTMSENMSYIKQEGGIGFTAISKDDLREATEDLAKIKGESTDVKRAFTELSNQKMPVAEMNNLAEATTHVKENLDEAVNFNGEPAALKSVSNLFTGIQTKIQQNNNLIKDMGNVPGSEKFIEILREENLQLEAMARNVGFVKMDGTLGLNEMSTSQLEEMTNKLSVIKSESSEVRRLFGELKIQNESITQLNKFAENAVFTKKAIEDLRKGLQDGSVSAIEFNQKFSQIKNNEKIAKELASQINKFAASSKNSKQAAADLADQLRRGNITIEEAREKFKRLREEQENTHNKGNKLADGIARISRQYLSLYAVFNRLRELMRSSIEFDKYITELQIVTRESDSAMEKIKAQVLETSKQLGVAANEMAQSITTFSRLGYSEFDANKIAELTSKLQKVGDIGAEDAQNAITAVIKAFGVDINDLEAVMDKMVIVGNNYPISVSQLATAINNSSSILSVAGNSLEETLAILMAANTTVQDASKASTAVRTLTARIRNTTAELDELGEDTITTSKYEEMVSLLTKHNVQLRDANGEYRSTYAIMSDISDIWATLRSDEQAALTTTLAATRGQDVFSSLVTNFDSAKRALNDMRSSAGQLNDAYGIYVDSINGKMEQLKNTWLEFGTRLFDERSLSDIIEVSKGLVDILSILANFIKHIGGLKTLLSGLSIIISKNLVTSITKFIYSAKNSISAMRGMTVSAEETEAAVKSTSAAFSGWVMAIMAVVTVANIIGGIWDDYVQKAKEVRESDRNIADEAVRMTEALNGSIEKLASYGTAIDKTSDERKEYIQTIKDIIEYCGDESASILSLADNYGVLSEKVNEFRTKKTNDAIDKSANAAKSTIKDLMNELGSAFNDSELSGLLQYRYDTSDDISNIPKVSGAFGLGYYDVDGSQFGDVFLKAFQSMVNDKENGAYSKSVDSLAKLIKEANISENNLFELFTDVVDKGNISNIPKLKEYLKILMSSIDSTDDLYTGMSAVYNALDKNYSVYVEHVKDGNKAVVESIYDPFKKIDSVEAFNEYKDSLIKAVSKDDRFDSEIQSAEMAVTSYLASLGKYDEFIVTMKENTRSFVTSTASDFSDLFSKFDSIAGGVDKITDSMRKLEEGTALTKSELMSLVEKYPQLLDASNLFTDGSIEGQKAMLNSILDSYEKQYDAAIDEKINELKVDQAAIKDQLELEEQKKKILTDIDIDRINESITNQGELIQAIDELNELQGKNYVKFEEGKLKVSAEALSTNLEQEGEAALQGTKDVWEPYARVIADAHVKGGKGGVDSINTTMKNTANVLSTNARTMWEKYANTVKAGLAGDVAGVNAFGGTIFGKDQKFTNWFDVSGLKLQQQIDSGKAVSLSYKGKTGGFNIGGKSLSEWVSEKVGDIKTRVSQLQVEYDNITTRIDNLKSLKNLDLTSLYGKDPSKSSSSSSNKNGSTGSKDSSTSKNDTEFAIAYRYHQHLLAMDQEKVQDYLVWLDEAYKEAYKKGEIELDDYFKYEEEVYSKLRELVKDAMSDIEHEISMRQHYTGENKKILSLYKDLISDVESEIKKYREQGLDDTDDYIQELQDKWFQYKDAIDGLEEDVTESAKNAIDKLIDYRISMLKQEVDDLKSANDKKLSELKDFYDKQKNLLKDEADNDDYLDQQAEKRKKITDLQLQISQLELDDSAWAQKKRLDLQEELMSSQKELAKFERDHAIDQTTDLLDRQLELQEKAAKEENDALEEKLKSAKEIYEQALEDIRNGSVDLYNEMIEWNAMYGDGIDDTIKTAWEEATKALENYYDTFDKRYKDINLDNTTGYQKPTDRWDNSIISGSNPNNKVPLKSESGSPYGLASSATRSLRYDEKNRMKGDDVKALQYALNQLGYGNSGTQSIDGSFGKGTDTAVRAFQAANGLTVDGSVGPATRAKLKALGYASGTRNATPGLHSINELGMEDIFMSSNGTQYKLFSGGEKVLNARATNFLYDFANASSKVLGNISGGDFSQSLVKAVGGANPIQISTGDIVINGNADMHTVSEIRRAQRDNVDFMLKQFAKLQK